MSSIKHIANKIQGQSARRKTAEMLEREYLEKARNNLSSASSALHSLHENLDLAWNAALEEGGQRSGQELIDVEILQTKLQGLEKKLKELYAKAPEDDWY